MVTPGVWMPGGRGCVGGEEAAGAGRPSGPELQEHGQLGQGRRVQLPPPACQDWSPILMPSTGNLCLCPRSQCVAVFSVQVSV